LHRYDPKQILHNVKDHQVAYVQMSVQQMQAGGRPPIENIALSPPPVDKTCSWNQFNG